MKVKQGLMLTMAIADKHPMGLKHRVLRASVRLVKLNAEDGVTNLIAFLEGIFKVDKLVLEYNNYKRF